MGKHVLTGPSVGAVREMTFAPADAGCHLDQIFTIAVHPLVVTTGENTMTNFRVSKIWTIYNTFAT